MPKIKRSLHWLEPGLALLCVLLLSLPLLPGSSPRIRYESKTFHNTDLSAQGYYVTRTVLQNAGRRAITAEDMAAGRPLWIEVDGPELVYHSAMGDQSAREAGFARVWDGDAGLLSVSFARWEPGQEVTVELYHHLPTGSSVHAAWAAGGEGQLVSGRIAPAVLRGFFGLFTVLFSIALVGQIVYLARHRSGEAQQGRYVFWGIPIRRLELLSRRTRLGMWITRHWPLCFFVFWALLYGLCFL